MDVCIAGDINLDAAKYQSIPAGAKALYESWLDMTSSTGLDLLQTGPTFKSFGKFQGGRHHISTLDQVYISESVPARAILLPDAVTDHFPVLADLQVQSKGARPKEGLETVSKRNLASIDSTAFKAELIQLGVNNWPTPSPEYSVDAVIEDFYSVLNPIIDRHAPEKTFRLHSSIWWSTPASALGPILQCSRTPLLSPFSRGAGRTGTASYRPISVLPALSKVLETIVINQFLDYLDDNGLLPPAQHGFRRAHSTVTALVKTIQKLFRL